jgi:hypothetical protein
MARRWAVAPAIVQAQPGVRYLAGDAGPVVEVGRGEKSRIGIRVTVLSGLQVLGHQRGEPASISTRQEYRDLDNLDRIYGQ